MGIYVIAQQTQLVTANPDVSFLVASHTVDVTINAHTCQSQLVTEGGVPCAGILIVFEEGSLTVEPDIIHLVGKHLQRLGLPDLLCGNVAGAPDGMLLMHHVTTYKASVIIDDDGTVLTLTDRAYQSLRYAVSVVSIAELIRGLLLHVKTDDSLVGNGSPEVLVTIHINDAWDGLDTHSGEILLHVALETLCLRMIDAVARGCLDEQVTVQRLLNGVDVTVGQ